MKPILLAIFTFVTLPIHGMFIKKTCRIKSPQKYYQRIGFLASNSQQDQFIKKIMALPISEENKRHLCEEFKNGDRSKKYLNFVCDLPWDRTTKDKLDMVHARKILDADHYGLELVKERILEFVAIKKLNKNSRSLNALCLIGKPGIGKTSIGASIARVFGRRYQIVGLGGTDNAMYIKGNERGWTGAIPGRIIKAISLAQSKNPVMVLDEIDKVSQSSHNGSPAAALLEVLDPQQNKVFSDHYVEIPFDLSQVLFIATANYKDQIPKELLNRMYVIELPSYSVEDKIQIAQKHLIKQVEYETGLIECERSQLSLTSATIASLINDYTNEAGVRELKQMLNRLAANMARFIAGDPSMPEQPVFTEKTLQQYLGKPKNNIREMSKYILANNSKE